jgi:HEPN domain-containing protein
MAETAIAMSDPFFEPCCYHAQQCAEKYLKGYLTSQKIPFRWVHDLKYLVGLCGASDPGFTKLEPDAETLTRLAEPSRYPVPDEMEITAPQARAAMEIAGRIRSFVLSRSGG